MTTTVRTRRGGREPLPPRFRALRAIVAAAVIATLAAATADAAPAWRACLSCHDDAGLETTTGAGEPLSLAVNPSELAGSVHRKLDCRGCHPGVQLDVHPDEVRIASREEYRAAASRPCRGCHAERQLHAASTHALVVAEEQRLSCVLCHGSHGIRSVSELRGAASVNDYCMICHEHALSVRRPDGTPRVLEVSAAGLRASVHPDHACDDCHAEYSVGTHRRADITVVGEGRLAATRTCARCHSEKLRQAEGSIHFALLRSGAPGAPGCTTCHSAHEVAPKERFATLAGVPCRGCHAQVFEAYAGSMHGVARASGKHFDAPLCANCHRAHDVRGSDRPELVRAACSGCHPTAASFHAAWLPNASLHLSVVSCVACHAPQARRVVALRLVEEGTGRQLGEREVSELLGEDVAAALDPGGAGIDGLALWSALRRLESLRGSSAAHLDVVGRLELARGIDAHRLSGKEGALRECETCHQAGAPAFEEVVLSLAREGAPPRRIGGASGMLTDAAAIVSVHGFYALGATRQKVLDWLLVLAVAGGLAVVSVHLSVRLWSRRNHKGE